MEQDRPSHQYYTDYHVTSCQLAQKPVVGRHSQHIAQDVRARKGSSWGLVTAVHHLFSAIVNTPEVNAFVRSRCTARWLPIYAALPDNYRLYTHAIPHLC